MNDRISTRLAALHPLVFVLVMLVATYLVVLPAALLAEEFEPLRVGPGAASLRDASLLKAIFVAGFFMPLSETFLFQWLPIRICRTWLKRSWRVAIVVSAVLFGVVHSYSLGYVINTFLGGLILAYAFAVRDAPGKEPGMLVFSIHSLRNVIAALVTLG